MKANNPTQFEKKKKKYNEERKKKKKKKKKIAYLNIRCSRKTC